MDRLKYFILGIKVFSQIKDLKMSKMIHLNNPVKSIISKATSLSINL